MQQQYYLKQNYMHRNYMCHSVPEDKTMSPEMTGNGCKEIERHSLNEVIVTNNPTAAIFTAIFTDWYIEL